MKFVKYSCPHCKYVIEPYSVPYYTFGDPRCACPNCKGIYIATHIVEWDLLNPFSKIIKIIYFYFHFILSPLVGSFFISFIIMAVGQSFITYLDSNKGVAKIIFISLILLLYPVIFYYLYHEDHAVFWNSIRESKKRTSNLVYKNELEKL